MLINLTNHPLEDWEDAQRSAARQFGVVKDLPFPQVSPELTGDEVLDLAVEYLGRVKHLLPMPEEHSAIHLMGEQVFTALLVQLLQREGYRVVASTTYRDTSYEGEKKITVFRFVRFREYPVLS
jgi:HEAT repeat protein